MQTRVRNDVDQTLYQNLKSLRKLRTGEQSSKTSITGKRSKVAVKKEKTGLVKDEINQETAVLFLKRQRKSFRKGWRLLVSEGQKFHRYSPSVKHDQRKYRLTGTGKEGRSI